VLLRLVGQGVILEGLGSHMRRREFITLFGGAAVAWPGIAISQPSDPLRRIGVLMAISEGDAEVHPRLIAFQKSLHDLGWTDGRNTRIDYRFVVSDPERIRAAAMELVSLKPDVLVAQSSSETRAVLELTRTVPIVSPMLNDPVGSGLVQSFGRPGGNITGFTNFEDGMGGKWLGLLKAIAPDVSSVAIVLHPNDEGLSAGLRRSVETAASSFGVGLTLIRNADIELALDEFARDTFARKSISGLIVFPGVYTGAYRYSILALAAKYRWPAICPSREWVVSGGLMSYGTNIGAAFRLVAEYVDRILRGERPSELPIQAPTKFQLVISLWAANALDLTVPPSLLAIADEVIE
jgi:putative tryptophan/tyrosine transport system substrate-binding protein